MTRRGKGILFMLCSALSFSFMNVFVRMAGDLPSIQKSFFRNAISLLAAAVLLRREGTGLRVEKKEWKHLFFRSLFGTVGVICNFYAVDHMLLSDASMLNKLSPFFTLLFSAWLLGERTSAVQLLLACAAFGGSLLILKPSASSLGSFPALVALAGGLCAGLAYTEVRALGKHGVNKAVVIFVFSAFSCLTALPWVALAYAPMTPRQLGLLLLAGLAATGGQFGITAAYGCAPASEVSVYDYSLVLFSAVLGYVFFGQMADALSFLGYAAVCGSGAAMALYNRKCRSGETL